MRQQGRRRRFAEHQQAAPVLPVDAVQIDQGGAGPQINEYRPQRLQCLPFRVFEQSEPTGVGKRVVQGHTRLRRAWHVQ
ncbi:hypothetical protein D3C84_735610 [compost metagenome]